MSFASVVFFIFLPIVFAAHWLCQSRRWQNCVLLTASYIFYGWWDWRFCFLMLGSSMIDYWAALAIEREPNQPRRKTILTIALSANLVILGFFKYCNFFIDSLVTGLAVAGLDFPTWSIKILLPVGISFYTFQTMSYTLDVYWRRFRPLENALDYLTFVSFFPQLVAGPIERATSLLPQFHAARSFSGPDAAEGCRFVLWGLAKKMLIADNLAPIVNAAFNSQNASGPELFLATICFAFQIYCDFSGYCDIAIGVALLFGVRLMRNFAYPYFSESITEFWRRWHISLSTWFRDYVYIPLGGNRGSKARTYRNLMAVALLSGLWHGAAWHFIIWGFLHGAYLVIERALAFSKDASKLPAAQAPAAFAESVKKLGRVLRTFALVCLAWIFFRVETVGDGFTALQKISISLTHISGYSELAALCQREAFALGLLALLLLAEWSRRREWNPLSIGRAPGLFRWAAYTALFWVILLFGTQRTADFIYFQF